MRLFLITHAHTEQSQDVAVDEWTLSTRGAEQAKILAEASFWDEVDRVVVSSEQKCWLTVENVAKQRGFPVWIESRFDELRRGGWTENYASQVSAVFAEPMRSIAGWERAADVRKRVLAGVSDLRQRFPDETVALVGHGLCLSILRAELLGRSKVDFLEWQRLSFATYASFGGDPLALINDFSLSTEGVR